MPTCRICHASGDHKSYVAKEMMFGYKDEFDYFECHQCGCVQIKDFPSDLSKYYPENYYSFQESSFSPDTRSWLTIFADRQRSKHYLGYGGWLGQILAQRRSVLTSYYKNSSVHFFHWLREAKVRIDYKILDVGCGAGDNLLELQRNGFSQLTGIDPFIKEDIVYSNGVKIFKKSLGDVAEKFDFVMLNHSLEHMENQSASMKEIYRILKPNRYALIRIPVASFAWKNYRTNWVQLDAPRHFFLHTVESLKSISQQAGLELKRVIYDSTEFQFIGSERYIKNIPLFDLENPYNNSKEEELSNFRQKAKELNENNEGDQACFYLYKS